MDVDQKINDARQAWLRDKHDDALELFRSAHSDKPDDLRLAIEFASYLGMRFEIDEAEAVLQKCEMVAGGNPRVWHQIGLGYERSYRPDDALRCFRRATEDEPHLMPVIKMVEWYERRGRIDLARELLDQCKVDVPRVQLWDAKLLQRNGDLAAAEDCLRGLTHKSGDRNVGLDVRVSAWYALAELFDEQDLPTQAISAAREAKRLQLPKVLTQLEVAKSLRPLEESFVATVEHEHYQRWSETSHAPTALLTGPPRSGTSMMCRMLGMCDGLTVADEIEAYPTYLQPRMLAGQSGTSAGEVLDSLDELHLEASRQLYRKWLSAATGRDICDGPLLDKFPSTTCLVAPFRRMFPNAVIVVAIRDPRDVVLSCFLRHLEINPVSAMFSRLDLAAARCSIEMQAWLKTREKLTSPWHEVRYEDVVAGNYRSLATVLQSLGLKWDDRFADIRSSLRASPVRSPTYAQLRKPITSKRIGRWQLYREFLEPQLGLLNDLAKRLGYDA